MKLKITNKTFSIALENNATTDALAHILPITLDMKELNGNEKYSYLNGSLPTNAKMVGTIHAGDVMLYGDNCLVVFYETFKTPYSYTKIGKIENFAEMKKLLNKSSVKILWTN